MTRVAQAILPPLRLALEAERLLAEEWLPGSRVVDFLVATDHENLEFLKVSGARRAEGDARIRQVTARVPLKPGRSTHATADYKVFTRGVKEGMSVYIEADIVLHDILFCEHFCVKENISLEPMPDGSVFVAKDAGVDFSQDFFPRSFIETRLRLSQQKAGKEFLDFLWQRATEAESSPKAPPPSVVEIWELQRRITLFHHTWRAPFLPHDLQKKWRWLDKGYRKHPWTLGTRDSASRSEVPPLRPPEGWANQSVEWFVVKNLGHCDKDGWQYAADFYDDNNWWGDNPTFNHCRRRLWRRPLDLGEEESCSAAARPSMPRESGGSAPCVLCWGLGVMFTLLVLVIVFVVPPLACHWALVLSADEIAGATGGVLGMEGGTSALNTTWPSTIWLLGCGSNARVPSSGTGSWWLQLARQEAGLDPGRAS
jgi:hypothetical protein